MIVKSACSTPGCIAILLVVAACVTATLAAYSLQSKPAGDASQGGMPAIPTVTPMMVPLEAFNHAIDAQRDVTIKSYETIITVELAHAGAEITRNISWWIVVVICAVIILVLLAKG